MTSQNEFVIPTYIDTNTLLDLLASIEGGFSLVEKISSQTSETGASEKAIDAKAGTEFGIPNVLSLLRLSLTGSLSSKHGTEITEQKEIDRYHTYGSLLHRLRSFLIEEGLMKVLEDEIVWQSIEPSDFVELHGLIRPNPLTDSLQRLDRLIAIFQIIEPSQVYSNKAEARGKRKAQSDMKQMKQIREFFAGVLKDIEGENVRKFLVDVKDFNQCQAVILLFTDYLRDKTFSEISFKEYRLLGKVVRKIDQSSDGTIDLLTGTGLGGIGKETLSGLFSSLSSIEGMSLPDIETEIPAPSIEIVPIAIYI